MILYIKEIGSYLIVAAEIAVVVPEKESMPTAWSIVVIIITTILFRTIKWNAPKNLEGPAEQLIKGKFAMRWVLH